jgi:hypothetical protein
MIPMTLRARLVLVTAVYAAALATATLLVYERHLQYVNHPEDVAASGGMYAGGDLILEIFIGCMLLVPTLFLALAIRKSEELYTAYSKFMLGLSLTAPLCLAIFSIPAVSQGTMLLGEICIDRLFGFPVVMTGLVFSRLLASFDRAKRIISYALIIEFLTFVLIIVLLLFSGTRRG